MASGQAQHRRVIYPHDGCIPSGVLSLAPGDVLEVDQAEGVWWKGRLVQSLSGDRTPLQPHHTGGYFYRRLTVPVPNEPARKMSLPRINSLTDCHSFTYKMNDYISQVSPSPEMNCIICFNLASRTHQTTCCGQTVCLACAETWKETNNSCPQCRKAPLNLSIDVRVERIIADLKVYCRNHCKGCGWTDRLGDEAAHLENSCQYHAKMKCEHQGSSVELPLKDDLQKHMSSECQRRRPVQCPCCKADSEVMKHAKLPFPRAARTLVWVHEQLLPQLTYNQLITEHYKVCPEWPMRCPNKCPQDNLTRASLQAHLNEDCPEQLISCQFSEAGCGERAKRRKMEDHNVQKVGQHMAGMLKDYIKLKKEHAVLMKEHAALKKKPAAELNVISYSSDSETSESD